MREVADAERIRRFMQAFGAAAEIATRVYFTGGATAVLLGWRTSTIDVDIRVEPDTDAMFRAIPRIKESLQLNVELASPVDFIPVRAGWQDRSPFVAQEGRASFHHFDRAESGAGLTDDGILRREPLEDAMAEQSRLDVLEGRMEELPRHWDHLFGELGRLDHKVETLGGALSARIDALDQKFDRRVEALEQKFDRRFETVDRKMDELRGELSKQFRWTFSTMLALLGMMLTVGAGAATALLRANP